MSIIQTMNESETQKITEGSDNPRIYHEEWKCAGCGVWEHVDEIVWAKDNGELTVTEGKPWCVGCVPEDESLETLY